MTKRAARAAEKPGLEKADPILVRLSIEIREKAFVFRESKNTSHGVLVFDLEKKLLKVAPPDVEVEKPFGYVVQLEAVGFQFEPSIDQALIWIEPKTRPPFLEPPTLSPDASVIELKGLNASDSRQSTHFELIPSGGAGLLPRGIDPTIVNNPDPPAAAR